MSDIRIAASQVRVNQNENQEISKSTFLGRVYSNLSSVKERFEKIADLFREKISDLKEFFRGSSEIDFTAKSIRDEKVSEIGSTAIERTLSNEESIGFKDSVSNNQNSYSDFTPLERQETYSRIEDRLQNDYKRFENGDISNEKYSRIESFEKYTDPSKLGDGYSKPTVEKYSDPDPLIGSKPNSQPAIRASEYSSRVFEKIFDHKENIDLEKADGKSRTYTPLQLLGQGNYKAALKVDKVKYALDAYGNETAKVSTRVLLIMDADAASQKNDIDVQSEIKVNNYLRDIQKQGKNNGESNLTHVSIAKPVTYNGETVFSSKLMEGGALSTQISKLDDNMKDKAASDMCKGIAELHQHGIIHRDIKVDNFLMDANGNVKIADMGKAFLENEGAHNTATFAPARPPGLNFIEEWDKKADVYQLGVALFQLYSGKDNVHNLRAIMAPELTAEERKDPAKFYAARNEGVEKRSWSGMDSITPAEKREFIIRMLNKDPSLRPDMDEVVNFFSKE